MWELQHKAVGHFKPVSGPDLGRGPGLGHVCFKNLGDI